MKLNIPPNEPEAGRAAIIRLEHFEGLVWDARGKLNEVLLKLLKERMKYAADRPLTEAERTELVEHVRYGGALCCHKGLTWLRGRLPEPWAWVVSGWAYDHLSCSPCGSDEQAARAKKVREMPLEDLLRRMREDDHVAH